MKISELKSAIRKMIINELNEATFEVTPDQINAIRPKAEKDDVIKITEDDVNEMAFLKGPKAPEGLETAITAVVKSNSDAELKDIRRAIKTDEKVIKALEKAEMNVKDDLADNQLNKFIELLRGNREVGKPGRKADPNKPAKEPKKPKDKDLVKLATSGKKKEPKFATSKLNKSYTTDNEEGPSEKELRALASSGGADEKGKVAQLRQQEKTKLVKAFLKGMRDKGIVDNANRVLDKEKYADAWSKAKIEIEDKVSKLS